MTEGRLPAHRHHPAQRASHDDREQVAEQLREAAGDGRIDLGELEERLERAFAAKTYDELAPLTADLVSAADSRIGEPLVLKTNTGTVKQDGHWVVPRLISATTLLGVIIIDFTEAVCRHREVTLEIDANTGTVEVIVPRGWSVTHHGTEVNLGSVKNLVTDPPAPGSPTLHVTGRVTLANVRFRYPAPPRRGWWKRRKRRP